MTDVDTAARDHRPRASPRSLMADLLFTRRAVGAVLEPAAPGPPHHRRARSTGQEAAVVGAVRGLDLATDWLVPYYRDVTGFGALGDEFIEQLVVYWRGHPDGGRIPDGVRCLPVQISLGTQLPHAAGLAWGLALRGDPGVVCTFVGDGATSEGDFYEAINLAGVQRVPLIVVCINNGWAISTPDRRARPRRETFAAKADAAGIPGRAGRRQRRARGARSHARARAGGPRPVTGPTLLEARHLPHGRAHQLRRPHPLRPRRRAAGLAAARSDRAVPHRSCSAPAIWDDERHAATAVDAVEARLERIIDARARARGRSRGGTRPRHRRGRRAHGRATRRDRRSERARRRARRRVRCPRRAATATPGRCRGEHDHARGDPRDARSTRWRATSVSCCSARTSARTAACSAPPTASLDRFGPQRVFDMPISESAIVGATSASRSPAWCRSPRSSSAASPCRRTTRSSASSPASGTAAGAASTARSPCAPRTAAASARPSTTPTRSRRPTRTRPGLTRRGAVERGRRQGSAHQRDPQRRPRARLRADPLLPHDGRRSRRRAPRAARPRARSCVTATTRSSSRGVRWSTSRARRRRRRARRTRRECRRGRPAHARAARHRDHRARRRARRAGRRRARGPAHRRASAPRWSPRSRRRRSTRSRHRSGASRATTSARRHRWSRTGAAPTWRASSPRSTRPSMPESHAVPPARSRRGHDRGRAGAVARRGG